MLFFFALPSTCSGIASLVVELISVVEPVETTVLPHLTPVFHGFAGLNKHKATVVINC